LSRAGNNAITGIAGFTLIEVVIGLAFLAIGFLAIGSLQTFSMRGNTASNNLMWATYAAQDGLEFLKSLPLTSPRLSAGAAHKDATLVNSEHFQAPSFNRSYTVTSVNDPHGNCLRIDYVVTWNDGADHGITVSTIRSQ
jgi:Tfp pilus assembly protein PilV